MVCTTLQTLLVMNANWWDDPTEVCLKKGWEFFKRALLLQEETGVMKLILTNLSHHKGSSVRLVYVWYSHTNSIPQSLIPEEKRMPQVKT